MSDIYWIYKLYLSAKTCQTCNNWQYFFLGAIYDSSQSFDIPFYAAMGVSLLGAFITSFIRMFDKSSVDQVEGDADETLITLTKPNMEKRELLFPGDSHKMMEIIDSKLTVV